MALVRAMVGGTLHNSIRGGVDGVVGCMQHDMSVAWEGACTTIAEREFMRTPVHLF